MAATMKVLVIPDVHGRRFWLKALKHINTVDKIIFLGDYLDPYPDENISIEESLCNLEDISFFADKHSDKVITLLGNHDFHYLYSNARRSTRYTYKYNVEAKNLLSRLHLKIVYQIDQCLFSHAGISKTWLNNYRLKVKDLLNQSVNSYIAPLNAIGFLRGGLDPVGSCIWCDLRELMENPLTNYFQIIGHTQVSDAYVDLDFACLDCKSLFLVDTNTKLINKI